MCVSDKFFANHPIGNMLNRDQRTTVTLDYNNNGEQKRCFCTTKNQVSSNNFVTNENILEQTCDNSATLLLTKIQGEPGYRYLSQFKLKSLKLFTVYYLLLLIQSTGARPTPMSSMDTEVARILQQCHKSTELDKRKIDLARIRKMLESTINTSVIALQEANISGNAFVNVYEENRKLEDYHATWKNKKPEDYDLEWLYPNNKRLPKEYSESMSPEYRDTLYAGDITANATQLLVESYIRLQHLSHGLAKVLDVIKRDGEKTHQEDALIKLRGIFKDAIEKSQRVLAEIAGFLTEVSLCDDIVKRLPMSRISVRDFEYEEMKSWIVFREYANQLEFNIEAFKVMVDRIDEAEGPR